MNRFTRLPVVILLAALSFAYIAAPSPAADDTKTSKKKSDAKSSGTFEVYKDAGGKYRWRLKSTNGQTIATPGQGFAAKRGCMDNIESVRRAAANASVEEAADEK